MVTFQAWGTDATPVRCLMRLPWKTILAGFLTAPVALSVAVPPVHAAAPSEPAAEIRKRILVLYHEDKDSFPGLATTDRSLRESFKSALGKTTSHGSSGTATMRCWPTSIAASTRARSWI